MNDGTVLVVGSLNMDLVAQVRDMPRPGETIIGHSFHTMMGGKGANQAVAAARLGAKVAMIGCLGNDEFGGSMQEILERELVDTSGVRSVENVSSGTAMIIVDQSGENSIIVAPGANHHLKEDDVQKHAALFQASSVVVLQLEIPVPTVSCSMNLAKKYNKTVILNPAPMQKLPEDMLGKVDFLILNEVEAEELTGQTTNDFDKLVAGLRALPCKKVVLTLGRDGAAYIDDAEVVRYPAFRVQAVDTTGAGDSFIGAFAGKIAQGSSADEAIRYAIKVSAVTVTRLGALAALPNTEEVSRFEQQWGAASL